MRYECITCGAHGFSPGVCTVCCVGERRPLGPEPDVAPADRAPRFRRVAVLAPDVGRPPAPAAEPPAERAGTDQ